MVDVLLPLIVLGCGATALLCWYWYQRTGDDEMRLFGTLNLLICVTATILALAS